MNRTTLKPGSAPVRRSTLGATLRALRKKHDLTLAALSRRTGFSISTLSKVENERVSLSYDKLMQLSEGLGIDISELFSAPGGGGEPHSITGRRSINKVGGGEPISTPNYEHFYLSTDIVQKKLIPLIAEPKARTLEEFGPLVRHPGEEFIFVLEGKTEVHTELYAPYVLCAGESMYLDSSMGHAFLRKGSGVCRLLGICSASESILKEAMQQNPAGARRSPASPVPRSRKSS